MIRDGVSGMLITDHRQLKRIHNFFSRSTENLLKEYDWLKAEVEALKRLHFQKTLQIDSARRLSTVKSFVGSL